MCFSAEASFGASAVLTTVGVIGWSKTEKRDFRYLALIPVFFGIQQFMEGLVWITILKEGYEHVLEFSTYGFIFFAWVIWPIYIPFAYWKIEKYSIRKKILLWLIFFGILVVSVLIYVLLAKGVHARILDCSIVYDFDLKSSISWLFGVCYVMTTVGSNFISGRSFVWVLGVINLLTYFFSKVYFQEQLISVWCFFAAISSFIILFIIYDLNKKSQAESIN